LARKSGDNNAAGPECGQLRQGEQSKRRDAHCAEIVGHRLLGRPALSFSLTNRRARGQLISLLNDAGELQMDEQLKSRFEQVLQHYADVIRERDDALLREKKAREPSSSGAWR
jgi:hypothetical protein